MSFFFFDWGALFGFSTSLLCGAVAHLKKKNLFLLHSLAHSFVCYISDCNFHFVYIKTIVSQVISWNSGVFASERAYKMRPEVIQTHNLNSNFSRFTWTRNYNKHFFGHDNDGRLNEKEKKHTHTYRNTLQQEENEEHTKQRPIGIGLQAKLKL